jgi:hypothetical protein
MTKQNRELNTKVVSDHGDQTKGDQSCNFKILKIKILKSFNKVVLICILGL